MPAWGCRGSLKSPSPSRLFTGDNNDGRVAQVIEDLSEFDEELGKSSICDRQRLSGPENPLLYRSGKIWATFVDNLPRICYQVC